MSVMSPAADDDHYYGSKTSPLLMGGRLVIIGWIFVERDRDT